MNTTNSILIIGKPGTSKTTFLAQFYTIARKDKSKVKFWKAPENIQPILDAVNRLRKGEETQSTPAEDNLSIVLPISIDGNNLEIVCPDYGGEQINDILEQREINEHWSKLIKNSNSWILFIRPQLIESSFDLSNKIASNETTQSSQNTTAEYKASEQASMIELLQFILKVKQVSVQNLITTQKLTVALTCWDEVKKELTPTGYMSETLPLLNQFLKSNWHPHFLNFIGISAQGFELKTQENKDKYLDDGPEKFSYIVRGNSSDKIFDLTELFADAV